MWIGKYFSKLQGVYCVVSVSLSSFCILCTHVAHTTGLNFNDYSNQSVALSKFINGETETKRFASASKWTLAMVVALNMVLDPTDVMDKVLPASSEPSDQGI